MSSFNDHALNEEEYYYLRELGQLDGSYQPHSMFAYNPNNHIRSSESNEDVPQYPGSNTSLRSRGDSFDSNTSSDYFTAYPAFPHRLQLSRSHSGCTDASGAISLEDLLDHREYQHRERSLSRMSSTSNTSLTNAESESLLTHSRYPGIDFLHYSEDASLTSSLSNSSLNAYLGDSFEQHRPSSAPVPEMPNNSVPNSSVLNACPTAFSMYESDQRRGSGGHSQGLGMQYAQPQPHQPPPPSLFTNRGFQPPPPPTYPSGYHPSMSFNHQSNPSLSNTKSKLHSRSSSTRGVSVSLDPRDKKLTLSSNESRALESTIVKACLDILRDANNHSLKAVELANTLRARVGTEPLSLVRDVWGGLLSLLEHYPTTFAVERVPKNDVVSLVIGDSSSESHDDGSVTTETQRSMRDAIESPSRCLHISNIQSNTSEDDIQQAFGACGEIEDITMVSQRSRRFAFVRFRLTEDAVRALHELSTLQPWIGNISFAHQEEPSSSLGFSSAPIPPPTTYHRSSWGGAANECPRSTPGISSQHSLDRHQQHIQHQRQQQDMFSIARSRGSSFGSNLSMGSPRSQGPFVRNESLPSRSIDTSTSAPNSENRYCKSVIAILTDDTYVPTQSWQCRFQQDAPFLNAIITQLQILGGVATISKLRGLLKSRLLAQTNVKSVPLKALLAAYPKYFVLNSNLVELTPDYMHPYNHIPAN